jgi:hypothetical protein
MRTHAAVGKSSRNQPNDRGMMGLCKKSFGLFFQPIIFFLRGFAHTGKISQKQNNLGCVKTRNEFLHNPAPQAVFPDILPGSTARQPKRQIHIG